MNNFLAAILTEHYKPLKLEILNSELPKAGQVLVKMITSGLCGAQINEIDAVKGTDKYMPHLMGHEGYGQVLSIGEGVTKVKPSDYVILHWRKGNGCDCFGGTYSSKIGKVGSGPVTTFAQQTIVSENRITPISKNDDLKNLYPLIGCAISTGYGVVKYDLNLNENTPILITGAGGLGLTIAFWCKVLYNNEVILIDKFEDKRKFAEKYSNKFYSIDTNQDVFNQIGKFKYIVDTTGSCEIISKNFNSLAKQGKLLLVGQPRVGTSLVIDNALDFFDGKTISSSDGGQFVPEKDISDIVEYVSNNLELANQLITHVISLKDINTGFDLMRTGQAGRIIINFED